MKNNFFKIILPVISMAVISVILILYSKKNLTNSYSVVSNSGYYFDTFISISIYEKDEALVENDKNLIAECFNICKDYELIFSHTNTDSELYKLNISSASTTKISSDLYNILSIADEYNSLTNGAFNVLIGNIEGLWDFKKCNIPDDDIIDQQLELLFKANYTLANNTITFNNSKSLIPAINLGGIAKGYIADKIKDFLLSNNVNSAIINLGGNILLIGEKPDKELFNIGITKPFSTTGENIASVQTSNMSVVTSGIYERYFEQNSTIYHHIIDPSTGYPVQNNLYSVTIISASSTIADILSTSAFVLGADKGMELINKTDDVYAVFITSDFKIILSDGLKIDNNTITIADN